MFESTCVVVARKLMQSLQLSMERWNCELYMQLRIDHRWTVTIQRHWFACCGAMMFDRRRLCKRQRTIYNVYFITE